jgi:two-component system, chemotaxis family, chemotaxis protein CheY
MARILVVDDTQFMRAVIGGILVSAGHEVVGEARTGAEAVELFQRLRPDLTILDITMPEMDGLSALSDILFLDPGARVIMCSARGRQSEVVEAMKRGATDFVVKPVVPERLIEAIAKALG